MDGCVAAMQTHELQISLLVGFIFQIGEPQPLVTFSLTTQIHHSRFTVQRALSFKTRTTTLSHKSLKDLLEHSFGDG